jgi:PAS domain S-box-containing protein
MNPLVLQAGVAGPLVLGLAIYSAARSSQGLVHRYLFFLLLLILSWMTGMVAPSAGLDPSGIWVQALVLPPTVAMAPLFLLVMASYARLPFAEERSGVWALLAPFGLFFVGFLTNSWHGLMMKPGTDLLGIDPITQAGPLYWAFLLWSNVTALGAFTICVRLGWLSPSRTEKRRMGLLFVAALLPLTAHFAFLFRWTPLSYSLTPASLGITALLVTAAIQRYSLLDLQPVARRDVIEASSDGVLIADADERIVDLNPAAAEILGASHDELCGIDLEVAVAGLGPFEPADAGHALLESLRAGSASSRVEVETSSGCVIELGGGSPCNSSGAPAGYFVVLRDRTSQRRAERLLYQSQKLESVGILAAGVAHEVNNPLSFVRANLAHLQYQGELLETEIENLPKEVAAELEDMSEVIGDTVNGLDRIHGIVQGLLRLSHPPTGRTDHCDVNGSLRDASRFAAMGPLCGVHFESALAEDLPAVHASPDQLVQVFLNLLLNAKHALDQRPGARVLARSEREGDFVVVRIEDNGPGVPEEIRSKIFDPFFTTRAPHEGTGLGLSIAHDIIRDHDGSLDLEVAEGGGACFVVRLPIPASGAEVLDA